MSYEELAEAAVASNAEVIGHLKKIYGLRNRLAEDFPNVADIVEIGAELERIKTPLMQVSGNFIAALRELAKTIEVRQETQQQGIVVDLEGEPEEPKKPKPLLASLLPKPKGADAA